MYSYDEEHTCNAKPPDIEIGRHHIDIWEVCDGGNDSVIRNIKFCPYCGKELVKGDTMEKLESPPARTFYESCAKNARCQSADMAQTAFLQSIAFSLATIADAKTFLVEESYKPEKKEDGKRNSKKGV